MKGTNSPTEQLPSSWILILVLALDSIFAVAGILGNVGIVIYNVFFHRIRTPTSCFIISLAVSDILVCINVWPLRMVYFTQVITGAGGNPSLYCVLNFSIGGSSVILSVVTVSAITVDRFLFIKRPLKYPRIMTWPRTYAILAVIWLAALADVLAIFFHTKPNETHLVCDLEVITALVILVLQICIPMGVIAIFNYKIFRVARKQRRRINVVSVSCESSEANSNASRTCVLRELKLVKTFLIVIGLLLVFVTPSIVVVAIRSLICPECVSTSLYVFMQFLLSMNSYLNPFVYGIRHKEYRNAFLQVLSKFSQAR